MAQLLSNLPTGAKVKFGKYSVAGETPQDITWMVLSQGVNYSGSTTLITDKLIDQLCYDAAEPNSPDTVAKGNGKQSYELSNIRQWLNSDANAGEWYTAHHAFDQAPTAEYVTHSTPYAHRPGFLNAFDAREKRAILPTTITCHDYERGVINLVDKVFLPSLREATHYLGEGVDSVEGIQFAYFANNGFATTLSAQAYAYSPCSYKPANLSNMCPYLTRTGIKHPSDSRAQVCITDQPGSVRTSPANTGWAGIRPILNLSPTLSVSDATDSEGCYTFLLNTAPIAPAVINVPTLYGGKTNPITWSNATDVDGDIVTYILECSVNGGEYTPIYSGTVTAYAHLIPFGTSTVSYRVRAIDTSGESSAYTISALVTVVNNNAPVISGSDTNLGVKTDDFTGTYTITDANSDIVTVTEAIDGVQIRALVATLGETITYGVKGNTWLALANGSHTLTISATDGIDTTVRTIVFTKLADKFSIQNSTPWASSTMPSRIMLVVTRNIPSTSTFKVEVCNNGYDASPTWEDCTDAVKSGLVHVLTNKTKTAANWGVLVRVTVERNGATGACYVSAIGGNFE